MVEPKPRSETVRFFDRYPRTSGTSVYAEILQAYLEERVEEFQKQSPNRKRRKEERKRKKK